MSGKNVAKYKKFAVNLPGHETLTLYAGKKILDALEEVTMDMDLYKGVRLSQVMKAVYEQGLKDGRKEIFERVDANLKAAKNEVNYLPPGRPKK
jgi:hypothetical protein